MKKTINRIILPALLVSGWMLASPAYHASAATMQESAEAQQVRNISGRIVDEKGVPVYGATIQNLTTRAGATADSDGRFSIVAETGQILQVYMLGYKEQSIEVTSSNTINIVLAEDTQMLEETVVVGYATQKKINVTGAASSISGDELDFRPVVNVMNALQGADPSMNITMSSGNPVDGHSINIRGVPSVNGGSPLILVDGVPGVSLSYINAADIESVSVLKDASASAVYGAKASAGVILVTTKSGSEGKTKSIVFQPVRMDTAYNLH